MSNIIKHTIWPSYSDETYEKYMASEKNSDIIIHGYDKRIGKNTIDEELNILIYEDGAFGDGGWDFAKMLFHEINQVFISTENPVTIYIRNKLIEKLGEKIINWILKLRKRSTKKQFILYLAKSPVDFSEFKINSYLTNQDMDKALRKMISTYKIKSNGKYIYDRKDEDWVEE